MTSSLARALMHLGHDPCLILPRYGSITAPVEDVPGSGFPVSFMGSREQVALQKTTLEGGIPVYLVQNENYLGACQIYDREELKRFLLFSTSLPEAIARLGLRPDVIHCHDWHTALAPLYLRQAGAEAPCVFTIHNLAYQGPFDREFLLQSGLSTTWQEHTPSEAPEPGLNFMSQGILLADFITTVSPNYASEILTPHYGEGLERLLHYRRNELCGITNGIDYDEYNPATDPHLARNYDSDTIPGRVDNKIALQKECGLPQEYGVPLFGMVSRLEEQKGIDLLLQAIDRFITETGSQLVALGEGREHYQRLLGRLALQFPDRLSVFTGYDERLGRLIYGGADMLLMPSRFEPCGLGQLIAMRYGAVPVVRHTGGLVDTVHDVAQDDGNGYVFQGYTVPELLQAVKRAEAGFYDRDDWQSLMRRNMNLDFSWKASAGKYEEIYLLARDTFRARSG